MFKKITTYFLVALVTVVLSACSVKEKREDCPLTVRFDAEKVNPAKCTGKVVVDAFKTSLETEHYPTMEEIESGWYFRIKKGAYLVTGVNGIKDAVLQDDEYLSIVPGKCFDPIFANYESFTSYDEEYVITKPLNKQYAILYISLKVADMENVTMRVKGNVSGMSIKTLEPKRGEFNCSLRKEEGKNVYYCYLPRQIDASLTLDVYSDGKLKDTIDIGRYIAQRYDWKADNLNDIYIDVDYVRTGITVSVIDWEKNIVIDNIDY